MCGGDCVCVRGTRGLIGCAVCVCVCVCGCVFAEVLG